MTVYSDENLRELALDAWRRRDEIAEQEARQHDAQELKRLLRQRLDYAFDNERDEPTSGEVVTGGVRFRLKQENDRGGHVRTSLVAIEQCSLCSAEIESEDLRDLEALGRFLDVDVIEHRETEHPD